MLFWFNSQASCLKVFLTWSWPWNPMLYMSFWFFTVRTTLKILHGSSRPLHDFLFIFKNYFHANIKHLPLKLGCRSKLGRYHQRLHFSKASLNQQPLPPSPNMHAHLHTHKLLSHQQPQVAIDLGNQHDYSFTSHKQSIKKWSFERHWLIDMYKIIHISLNNWQIWAHNVLLQSAIQP